MKSRKELSRELYELRMELALEIDPKNKSLIEKKILGVRKEIAKAIMGESEKERRKR